MENDEIIKIALKLTEENNSVYRLSAKNQAFMIKASDSHNIPDTFLTVKGPSTAQEWKSAFEAAGFTNVIISPFSSSGNLNITDVDTDFYNAVSERAKFQIESKPEGVNTPFTKYNPYGVEEIGFDSSDPRLGKTYNYDPSNEYQKYIWERLGKDQEKPKILVGWFDGHLIDWLRKLSSIIPEVKDLLDQKYANLYSSTRLIQYKYDMSIRQPDFDFKKFVPTKGQIKDFPIDMDPLSLILSKSPTDADEYPEDLIYPVLNDIISKAKSHKFFKQYTKEDMQGFLQKDIDEEAAKYDKGWNLLSTFLRGLNK